MKQRLLLLLLLSFAFSTAIIAQPVTDNLVAYYPFSDGTGFDQSGNGNNATIFGGESVGDCAGNENAALSVTPGNAANILFLNSVNNLFAEDSVFTISFWIRKDSVFQTSDATLLFKDETSSPPFLDQQSIKITTDNIVTFGQCSQANPTLATDNWHHIFVVYDNGSRSLYVDSNFEDSSELDFFEANNAVLSFGEGYSGVVDELMIFNRVLTIDEMLLLYTQFGTSSNVNVVIQEQVSVQPNPASSYVDIHAKGLKTIKLIDLNGQVKRIATNLTGNSRRIELDDFKSGIYTALLLGADERLLGVRKIVVAN